MRVRLSGVTACSISAVASIFTTTRFPKSTCISNGGTSVSLTPFTRTKSYRRTLRSSAHVKATMKSNVGNTARQPWPFHTPSGGNRRTSRLPTCSRLAEVR
jgi:hypothetical protein